MKNTLKIIPVLVFILVFDSEAQLISMQPQQYPVHLTPSMAGSSDEHRLVAGGTIGTQTSGYTGQNIHVSYDQRIKTIRSGVGVWFSSSKNKWNPIEAIFKENIMESQLPEKFYRNEQHTEIGIVVAPKFNFTSYGKIVYTLSSAFYYKHTSSGLSIIDQVHEDFYSVHTSSGSSDDGNKYYTYIRQSPGIKSNCAGISLLLNASSWYVSAGVGAKQMLIKEQGTIVQVEAGRASYLSEKYNLEYTSSTVLLPAFAGGISVPFTRRIFLTLSGSAEAAFYTKQFDTGDSSEFRPYLASMKRSKVHHSSISAMLRYQTIVAGISLVYFNDAFNAGISLGMQQKKMRIVFGIIPARSNMRGHLELTCQVKI